MYLQAEPHRKRIIDTFCALTSIDAESFNEREIADAVRRRLEDMGFTVEEDEAGQALGGNAGNLYGVLAGDPALTPVLFSAHLDTVQPGRGKRAHVDEKGAITGDSRAILGADDVNGITEILEGIRLVQESGCRHGDIEVLFTVAEERYALGGGVFDFSRVRSPIAYTLDMAEPVGKAAVQAPSIVSFSVEVQGRDAHAGFAPEKGAHAIKAAAEAMACLPLGRVEEDVTCNIGTVEGGRAANIVPDRCLLTGEIRSYRHARAMAWLERIRKAFSEQAAACGCTAEMQSTVHLQAYAISKDEPVCRRFLAACGKLGIPTPPGGRFRSTFGGSDNNHFAAHGLRGIVLGNGMQATHSVKEHTDAAQLEQGARLVAALIVEDET